MAARGALTPVERRAVEASPFAEIYPPTEKIKTIAVENFPALGKLAAMRFVEWVQDHPGGVVSLPTGKTPEHFIRWVQRLSAHWDEPEIRRELEQADIVTLDRGSACRCLLGSTRSAGSALKAPTKTVQTAAAANRTR